MSRRKISNKRYSELAKIHNNTTGDLNDDSVVFNRDDPLWYKRLEKGKYKGLFRPSLEVSNAAESPTLLDSDSNIVEPPPQNWYKPLEKYNTPLCSPSMKKSVRRSRNLQSTNTGSSISKEISNSDSEELPAPKRRLHLRGQDEDSAGGSAFFRALEDEPSTLDSSTRGGAETRKSASRTSILSDANSSNKVRNPGSVIADKSNEKSYTEQVLQAHKPKNFLRLRNAARRSSENAFNKILDSSSSSEEEPEVSLSRKRESKNLQSSRNSLMRKNKSKDFQASYNSSLSLGAKLQYFEKSNNEDQASFDRKRDSESNRSPLTKKRKSKDLEASHNSSLGSSKDLQNFEQSGVKEQSLLNRKNESKSNRSPPVRKIKSNNLEESPNLSHRTSFQSRKNRPVLFDVNRQTSFVNAFENAFSSDEDSKLEPSREQGNSSRGENYKNVSVVSKTLFENSSDSEIDVESRNEETPRSKEKESSLMLQIQSENEETLKNETLLVSKTRKSSGKKVRSQSNKNLSGVGKRQSLVNNSEVSSELEIDVESKKEENIGGERKENSRVSRTKFKKEENLESKKNESLLVSQTEKSLQNRVKNQNKKNVSVSKKQSFVDNNSEVSSESEIDVESKKEENIGSKSKKEENPKSNLSVSKKQSLVINDSDSEIDVESRKEEIRRRKKKEDSLISETESRKEETLRSKRNESLVSQSSKSSQIKVRSERNENLSVGKKQSLVDDNSDSEIDVESKKEESIKSRKEETPGNKKKESFLVSKKEETLKIKKTGSLLVQTSKSSQNKGSLGTSERDQMTSNSDDEEELISIGSHGNRSSVSNTNKKLISPNSSFTLKKIITKSRMRSLPNRMSNFNELPQYESTRIIDVRNLDKDASNRVKNSKTEVSNPRNKSNSSLKKGELETNSRNEDQDLVYQISEKSLTVSLSEEEPDGNKTPEEVENISQHSSFDASHRKMSKSRTSHEEVSEDNNLVRVKSAGLKITNLEILKPNDVDLKKLKRGKRRQIKEDPYDISEETYSSGTSKHSEDEEAPVAKSPVKLKIFPKRPEVSTIEEEFSRIHGEEGVTPISFKSDSLRIHSIQSKSKSSGRMSESFEKLRKNLENSGVSDFENKDNKESDNNNKNSASKTSKAKDSLPPEAYEEGNKDLSSSKKPISQASENLESSTGGARNKSPMDEFINNVSENKTRIQREFINSKFAKKNDDLSKSSQRSLESEIDSEQSENPLMSYFNENSEDESDENVNSNNNTSQVNKSKDSLPLAADVKKGRQQKQPKIESFFGSKNLEGSKSDGKSTADTRLKITYSAALRDRKLMDEVNKKLSEMKAEVEKEFEAKEKAKEKAKENAKEISAREKFLSTIQKKKTAPKKPKSTASFLVNGAPYKRPKLPRPQKWATDRLYKYIWKKIEPKYDLQTRVRSEKFVLKLGQVVKTVMARKKYENYKSELESLMKEMATMGLIVHLKDFCDFCTDFLPIEFCEKATPMILIGNKLSIPYDPSKLYTPLI